MYGKVGDYFLHSESKSNPKPKPKPKNPNVKCHMSISNFAILEFAFRIRFSSFGLTDSLTE